MLNIKFVPSVNRVAVAGLVIYKITGNVTGVPTENEIEQRHVLVYPNPGEEEDVQVVVQHFVRHEEVIISLHDMAGRMVYSTTVLTDAHGNATAPIATTPFQKGIYMVRITAPSGKAQRKLLIK